MDFGDVKTIMNTKFDKDMLVSVKGFEGFLAM